MPNDDSERVAVVETMLADHMKACNGASARNEEAHDILSAALAKLDRRLWAIMLLLVAGLGGQVARMIL